MEYHNYYLMTFNILYILKYIDKMLHIIWTKEWKSLLVEWFEINCNLSKEPFTTKAHIYHGKTEMNGSNLEIYLILDSR